MVDGRFWAKSADTNVTEDHEHLRDHEPLRVSANWSMGPESNRGCGGWIDEAAAEDETSRTPSCLWRRSRRSIWLCMVVEGIPGD
jgi:hypothetical protein